MCVLQYLHGPCWIFGTFETDSSNLGLDGSLVLENILHLQNPPLNKGLVMVYPQHTRKSVK